MLTIFILLLSTFSLANGSPCQVKYDELEIPHVETTNLENFYYCFGVQHGTDRAWEMDFFRRVASGRNAEVLGYSHLKSDLMMKLLDLPKLAERIWGEMSTAERKWFENYSNGVNEGFITGKNQTEFKDLGFEPETWRPIDSLLVLLLQSFDQTRKSFYRDYEEEKNKEIWKEKSASLFEEDGAPWENTILKEGEYPKGKMPAPLMKTSSVKVDLWSRFPSFLGEESGSNNWVISSKKSKTGHALMANDPHLDLKTPMFWYWIHIKSPDGEVIGGSLPGVPAVVTGTNGKVSWGLTNAYINSADAYFIKDLKDTDLESLWPTVKIKFGPFIVPFFFKKFERTKDGHPILPLETERDQKLVLRWSGFSLKPKEILPMFDLIHAKNVEEMNATLKQVGVPAWNFVFADIKGDVGFRVVGKAYRHTSKIPFGLEERTLEELKHEDYLSEDERPHMVKPARQYVYTANNRHWPADAAFYGGRAYSESFRGARIDELLQTNQDIKSTQAIQCDVVVTDAKYFMPKLKAVLKEPFFEDMEDFEAHDGSQWLPLYRRLIDITMESWKVNEYALWKILQAPSEMQKADLQKFLASAKSDIAGRTWGLTHKLAFNHLSRLNQWNFSPEIEGVGDKHTVSPGTAKWNEKRMIYEQFSGASQRLIIEMKARPEIYLSLPGLNRAYSTRGRKNPWQEWKDCQYARVPF